jgi:hypothetical protein
MAATPFGKQVRRLIAGPHLDQPVRALEEVASEA